METRHSQSRVEAAATQAEQAEPQTCPSKAKELPAEPMVETGRGQYDTSAKTPEEDPPLPAPCQPPTSEPGCDEKGVPAQAKEPSHLEPAKTIQQQAVTQHLQATMETPHSQPRVEAAATPTEQAEPQTCPAEAKQPKPAAPAPLADQATMETSHSQPRVEAAATPTKQAEPQTCSATAKEPPAEPIQQQAVGKHLQAIMETRHSQSRIEAAATPAEQAERQTCASSKSSSTSSIQLIGFKAAPRLHKRIRVKEEPCEGTPKRHKAKWLQFALLPTPQLSKKQPKGKKRQLEATRDVKSEHVKQEPDPPSSHKRLRPFYASEGHLALDELRMEHQAKQRRLEPTSTNQNTGVASSKPSPAPLAEASSSRHSLQPRSECTTTTVARQLAATKMKACDLEAEVTCMCLSQTSWNRFQRLQHNILLRSYHLRHLPCNFHVIVQTADGSRGMLVGTIRIDSSDKITQHREIVYADDKQFWGDKLRAGDNVFKWRVSSVNTLEAPCEVKFTSSKHKNRHFSCKLASLLSGTQIAVPKPSLFSTGDYFLSLLSDRRYKKLEQTARALDGCTLKIGTACSGSDVAVLAVKGMLESINKEFGVARLCFILKIVYIYRFV